MTEAKMLLPVLRRAEPLLLRVVLGSAIVALAYGWHLARRVLAARCRGVAQ